MFVEDSVDTIQILQKKPQKLVECHRFMEVISFDLTKKKKKSKLTHVFSYSLYFPKMELLMK
jgi:hypothetical protein